MGIGRPYPVAPSGTGGTLQAMQTVLLPHTDLRLSRIGFGCWTISRLWWGDDHDDARAIRTIHAALDVGINWVDTAPLYGHGHADSLVRQALVERPGALIATKVGVRWEGRSGHAESDLHPQHIIEDTEASLRRLGRDRIDLLQVHWPCEHGTPIEDTMDALVRLREAGKIRAIGLCNHDAAMLARARRVGPVASLQTPLSLLRREFEGALADAVMHPEGEPPRPVAALVYETLCRGLLTGRFGAVPTFPDSDLRSRDPRFRGARFRHARGLVGDLEQVSERVGQPMSRLALGWALSRPGVSCAVVGARRPEHVVEAAGAVELLARRRLWAVVDRIATMHGGWPDERV